MQMQANIQRWGNSLAVRLSGVARVPFEEGMPVVIEVVDDGVFIRKLNLSTTLALPFSEEELLQGLTAHTAHADEVSTLFSTEWSD